MRRCYRAHVRKTFGSLLREDRNVLQGYPKDGASVSSRRPPRRRSLVVEMSSIPVKGEQVNQRLHPNLPR